MGLWPKVHVGAGGCVKVAGVLLDLKFMWELAAVKRELAAMWQKVCVGAGGYVQGAGGYVNKPKIGYSSGPNPDLPDHHLTFT